MNLYHLTGKMDIQGLATGNLVAIQIDEKIKADSYDDAWNAVEKGIVHEYTGKWEDGEIRIYWIDWDANIIH